MKTNFNLFANHSITDYDSVKVAVKTYESFVPSNEEEAKIARDSLIDLINKGNADNEALAVSNVADSDNIVKALIPAITLTPAELTKSNVRKNAVNYAVSYKQFRIALVNGKYEVRQFDSPVTLVKVYKYLS